jgi:subtilisin family serine protease
VEVQFGGKVGPTYRFETNEDLVAVRTTDARPVEEAPLSGKARRALDGLETVTRFPDAGVEVFHVRSGSQGERDAVRTVLKAEPSIRFAGRVLSDPVFKPEQGVQGAEPGAATVKEPVLYTENIFVKFAATESRAAARSVLSQYKLTLNRAVDYIPNAYFVKAPEGTGLAVFEVALTLLRKVPGVEFCHPEIIRPRDFRNAFAQQWHLKPTTVAGSSINAHVDVVPAWKRTKGKGITIAVIDTGIDVDHEEFRSSGKVVSPRDATPGVANQSDPRPQSSRYEKHGTACAGVACANGTKGASGIAPAARLLPIRLMAGLGSQGEADAFAWAADHGADVISCSWGPTDGDWWDPADPAHRAFVPLPDNTRLAIEYALTSGRGGKGCVICWAAGNGNESVDNDGYASHPGVIAVAACNDTGTRSVYSDTGKALWCAFPSGDSDLDAFSSLPNPAPVGGIWNMAHAAPKTTGIWTTDWSGPHGYNRGGSLTAGDTAGNYTNSFGGTSSATPGVAGVAALVLALNKNLRYDEVKDILKRACDRVDLANAKYDATTGHSLLYGYGRVNALKAVNLAVAAPMVPPAAGGARKAPARRSGSAAGRPRGTHPSGSAKKPRPK